jgi:hypothetical protein
MALISVLSVPFDDIVVLLLAALYMHHWVFALSMYGCCGCARSFTRSCPSLSSIFGTDL